MAEALVAGALAIGAILSAAVTASANQPLPNPSAFSDFVQKSKPQWNFAQGASGHPACWPGFPIALSGAQNPGADPPNWPNSDQGCPKVNSPFPAYYSVKQCRGDEVRVSFTLYFAQDAFKPSGHRHDFENIIMVWAFRNGHWVRDRLLLSQHKKHDSKPWSRAESWDLGVTRAGKGLELPRIFVGFGSHAMYNNQGGLKDVVAAYAPYEYRGADYRVDPSRPLLIPVTDDNYAAKAFDSYTWGKATTTPAVLSRQLCSV